MINLGISCNENINFHEDTNNCFGKLLDELEDTDKKIGKQQIQVIGKLIEHANDELDDTYYRIVDVLDDVRFDELGCSSAPKRRKRAAQKIHIITPFARGQSSNEFSPRKSSSGLKGGIRIIRIKPVEPEVTTPSPVKERRNKFKLEDVFKYRRLDLITLLDDHVINYYEKVCGLAEFSISQFAVQHLEKSRAAGLVNFIGRKTLERCTSALYLASDKGTIDEVWTKEQLTRFEWTRFHNNLALASGLCDPRGVPIVA